jgi:hypothetical protein
MSTAYEQLVGLSDVAPDDWPGRADLEPLWLQAANERLVQQRETIPVLGKLADEVGIDRIERFDDLVPLLFAHSNYKSYPEGFITKGRWDLMNRWLDTLSTMKVAGLDVEGVTDQDSWVDRLHSVGQKAYVTSGTTGKNSFLPQTQSDEDLSLKMLIESVRRQPLFAGGERRPVFIFGPKHGYHRAALHFRTLVETFGRPDASYFLTEEPMRIAEITRLGDLRRRIADGTAMPSEIQAFERETAAKQEANAQRLDELMDALIEHRHEPMYVVGFWAQYWLIVERARARGVAAGEFHPDTVITGGGGTKGAVMPPDYEEQILHFFGISPDHVTGGYGMSEVSTALGEVDGRYRPAPWVIPLLLDDGGEKRIDQETGQAEGRFAFFDASLEGRWGGVITGDHVTVDFATPTPTVVAGSIERYSALAGGDDKLTCAGTIDSYVRGVME